MGLFDLFRSKKKTEAPAAEAEAAAAPSEPALTPWQQRVKGWRDLEDEQKLAICEEVLKELQPHFENAKIKPLPDDDEIDLRGRIEGIPIRVNLNDSGWVNLEMKIENRIGRLNLNRDHDKIPKDRDEDDDWADDDEIRVFLAKGIFVEGDDDDVNESLSAAQRLGESLSAWLFGEMERLRMSMLFAGGDQLSVGFDPNLDDMSDPIGHILESVGVMKTTAQGLSQGDRDMSNEPKVVFKSAVQIGDQVVGPNHIPSAAAAIERVTCSYCSTVFMLAPSSSHCPNCGAAYTE